MSSPKLLVAFLVLATQLLDDGQAARPPTNSCRKRVTRNVTLKPGQKVPCKVETVETVTFYVPAGAGGNGHTSPNFHPAVNVKRPKITHNVKDKGKITAPLDIVILLDKSKSVTAAAFKNEQNFMLKLIDSLVIGPKNTQIALVEFWSEAFPMFALNEYDNEADLREYIQKGIGCEGCKGNKAKLETALTDAVKNQLTPDNGMRPDANKFIIIVTDEVPEDEGRVKSIIAPLKAIPKLRLIVCGVGGNVNEKNVGYLASSASMALFYTTFIIFEQKAPADVIGLMRPPTYKHPIDLAIVMDVSAAGMTKHNIEARTFLRGIIEEFLVDKTNTHVALVTYGSKIQLQWDFNKYLDNEKLDKALADFKCANCKAASTEAGDALEFCRRHVFISETGSRLKSEKMVMLFTDSKAGNAAKLERSAKLLADSIHAVVAVGVGSMISDQLKVIASAPDLVYPLSDFTNLQGTADFVAEKIYKYALLPLPKCGKKIDMLFVVDRSGSLSEHNYEQEKQFMEGVVRELDVGSTKVQVGMEMFGVDAYPQWDFKQYKDGNSLMAAVSKMVCHAGRTGKCKRFKTSTAKALKYGYKEMADTQHGARADAKKVIVVLSDGHSTDLSSVMSRTTAQVKAKYKVIAIGVGDITKGDDGMKELKQIASGPNYVDTVPKFVNLPYISRFTAMEICHAAA